MSDELPTYTSAEFAARPLAECDAIMKGGVTSGIVYPYAVLEIARRYRFRSLGGTSAGAIAAAFAAAAEYSRSVRGDPDGFVRLQTYCSALPALLTSLFQPDVEYRRAVTLLKHIAEVGAKGFAKRQLAALIATMIGSAVAGWIVARIAGGEVATQLLAASLGLLLGAIGFLAYAVGLKVVWPVLTAKRRLPANGFGLCSGRTVPGESVPGLTDWLHDALQDIAFGPAGRSRPLTFGDLEPAEPDGKPILLRMITTNLSMARPHTLPELGMSAGFVPADWASLFPPAVMKHLGRVSRAWRGIPGARSFPTPADLPVIVAVRMSLSFPLLFKAVPIKVEDFEFQSVVKELGGTPTARRICTAWLSDGGISSNFPVHLFDSPLPNRPTFAISLDKLQCSPAEVTRRVLLPQKAISNIGVQVREITSLGGFIRLLMASAKDWQDQLSSEISGQRERVARIFLARDEGGLNLAMPKDRSQRLMGYGREVGQLFVNKFDFAEHRWRRLLAVHRTTTAWLDRGQEAWTTDFSTWYTGYQPQVKSYKKLTLSDRSKIGSDIGAIFGAAAARQPIAGADAKFPHKVGQLRIAPRF
jgi:hypothetical protein